MMIDMGNAGSGHRLRGGREGTAATRTAPWAATERPTAGARHNMMIDMGNAGSGHRLRGGRQGTAATQTGPWAATERPIPGARHNMMIDMGNAGSGHRLRGGRQGTAATLIAPWAATERPTAGARRSTPSGCTFWTLPLKPTLWHGRPSSSTRCASLAVVLKWHQELWHP